LKDLESLIDDLPRGTAILVYGLDYLVSKNGFKRTLMLVQRLRELAYLKDYIIILSIDPSVLMDSDLIKLEKEAGEISPILTTKISEDLLEVLTFIKEQNTFGVKPSYTLIGKDLKISKPTTRKRVRQLVSRGYISESIKGRSKVVELTEKGMTLYYA
jgi:DNA-binding MarR family transcriptional regulator